MMMVIGTQLGVQYMYFTKSKEMVLVASCRLTILVHGHENKKPA
jgi:hypothetical protein